MDPTFDEAKMRAAWEALYEGIEEFRSQVGRSGDIVLSETQKNKKRDEEYKEQLKKNAAAFAAATDATLNFAKQISSGNATTALNNAILGISGMLATKGPLGIAIHNLSKLYVHATEEFNKLFGVFKAISESGIVISVTDVTNSMNKLGLSMELTQQILTKNNTALAKFGGSALNGRQAFENYAEAVVDLREKFLNLGITATDFNDYQIQYMEMLQISGKLEKMDNDKFREGLRHYATELQVLSNLTGKQRKVLADEMKARETDLQFRLMARGKDPRQQAELNAMLSLVKTKLGDGMEQALKAGMLEKMSDPALQSMLIGVPNFLDFVKRIEAGGDDAVNAINELARQSKSFSDTMPNNLISNLREGHKLLPVVTTGLIHGNQATIVSIEEMRETIKKMSEGADKTTENLAKKENAELKAAQNVQNLTFSFTGLTTVMKFFAEAVQKATDFLNKLFGGDKQKPTVTTPAQPGAPASAGGSRAAAGGSIKTGDPYLDRMIAVESGGRNIPNQSGPGGMPTSTAFGLAQITKPTFENLVSQASPGSPLYRKTFQEMQSDINLQLIAAKELTESNKRALQAAGLGTSDAALYLAHFLGVGGAISVLKASNNAPLSSVVSSQAINANPHLQKMATVADIKAWAREKMNDNIPLASGGIVKGPTSGFPATLHGSEMVQPLDKNSILQKLATTPSNVAESEGREHSKQLIEETHQMTRKYDEMIKVLSDIRNIQKTLMMRTYA